MAGCGGCIILAPQGLYTFAEENGLPKYKYIIYMCTFPFDCSICNMNMHHYIVSVLQVACIQVYDRCRGELKGHRSGMSTYSCSGVTPQLATMLDLYDPSLIYV